MSDAKELHTNVEYRDGEPKVIKVQTARWENDYRYDPVYEFRMDGSTAVLTVIETDNDTYNVVAGKETREVAEETVENLPFVQGVVMVQ